MANQILIKRSNVTSVPSSLTAGELAYSEVSDRLFIGTAAGIDIIGGDGYYATDTALSSLNTNLTATITGNDAAQTAALNAVDTAQTAAVNTKANIASPTFTGFASVPTAASGNNSSQIANTQFVTTAINNLVGGAPGALDTLNELAAALGDDANFIATMTTSLASKMDDGQQISGGTF